MRTPEPGLIKVWNYVALVSWSVGLCVVIGRAVLQPHRAVMWTLYEEGARAWLHTQPLYGIREDGFIYGPLAAAFFAPLLRMPAMLRPVAWLGIDAAVFVCGVGAILWTHLYRRLDKRYCGIVLLLLLPLVLGNFDMSQANPFIAGLLMVGLAAAWRRSWTLAALSVAIATLFKLYPIVIGLLLILIAPKQFSWRLLLALLLLGLVPFLLQEPGYVSSQYRSWFDTRLADNRFYFEITRAPIDLWLLLVRLGGLPIQPWAYRIIQLLAGAGIALYCLSGKRKGWDERRLLVAIFSLGCIWMTLLGPTTEGLTYLLLVPAVVFAAVNALFEPQPASRQTLVFVSLALFLLTVAKNSLAPHLFGIWTRAMQPVAALVFLTYCLFWLLDQRQWSHNWRQRQGTALMAEGRR